MRLSKSITVALLFVLCLNLFSLVSSACSLADGYLPPPNYDLVKESDAILLAEAVKFNNTYVETQWGPSTTFTFKIIEAIKGGYTQGSFVHSGVNTYLGGTDENDFGGVRPGAGRGACNAYDYQVGKRFLLFVNKTKEGWSISGAPFSRINEEVSDNNSPWVNAVRHYVRISALSNYEAEKVELKKLLENAKGGKDVKKYPRGLIRDIEYFFKTPYPTKSYQDLITLFDNSSKEVRRNVLWALAWGKHPEAKPFIQTLLQSDGWEEYIAPVSEYANQTKDRSFVKPLGSAYPNIKYKQLRWPIMRVLIEGADEKDSGLMLAALESADEEEAGRLAVWFVRHPLHQATEIIRKLVDGRYQERWELAFSLAGLGDPGTLEWAKGIINNSDADRWMGYYIIARSPLDEADRLARAVIRGNNPKDLTSLIQGYKDSTNPNRWNRLRDIINLGNNDTQVNYWLRRTLGEMAEEGDVKSAEILRKIR